jgi:predicted amidophosphoribosyltransferase
MRETLQAALLFVVIIDEEFEDKFPTMVPIIQSTKNKRGRIFQQWKSNKNPLIFSLIQDQIRSFTKTGINQSESNNAEIFHKNLFHIHPFRSHQINDKHHHNL